jgi:hypothetical protein
VASRPHRELQAEGGGAGVSRASPVLRSPGLIRWGLPEVQAWGFTGEKQKEQPLFVCLFVCLVVCCVCRVLEQIVEWIDI